MSESPMTVIQTQLKEMINKFKDECPNHSSVKYDIASIDDIAVQDFEEGLTVHAVRAFEKRMELCEVICNEVVKKASDAASKSMKEGKTKEAEQELLWTICKLVETRWLLDQIIGDLQKERPLDDDW